MSTTDGTNKIPATLIPGDGIGPEIVDAVIDHHARRNGIVHASSEMLAEKTEMVRNAARNPDTICDWIAAWAVVGS